MPRQIWQRGHRWMWSSTAAEALGRVVKLSHHGSKASSGPVPLLMSKDSSQHSTHLTRCCSAHRAEEDRAWGSQGAHQTLCHPPLPGTEGTISTADSLLLPYRHPWYWPMVPPEQQHLLLHSTLQHTPSITHSVRAGLRAPLPRSWAHTLLTPTAPNQSVSLLPSWHCSCHMPFLVSQVWSSQQCRAMAPQST